MTVWSRLHPRRLVCCLALATTLSVLFLAPTAGAKSGPNGPKPTPKPQPTYLALGDSLAFGYSQAKFNSLYPEENPAAYNTGYVDDFGHVLQFFDHRLQIVNDGCPGETTDSFINGPCAYGLLFPLHHAYAGGTSSSQLSDALNYLSTHPGWVTPITIDIGANDSLGLLRSCNLELACVQAGVPGLLEHIAANLGLILTDLKTAAPHAEIIVMGLYNPYGATLPGGNVLTELLNETESNVAASLHARFANPLAFFNPGGEQEQARICLLTNMCTPLEDIHPTDLGYRVLAKVILHQYVLGLPFPGHGFSGHGFFGHEPFGHHDGGFGLGAHGR